MPSTPRSASAGSAGAGRLGRRQRRARRARRSRRSGAAAGDRAPPASTAAEPIPIAPSMKRAGRSIGSNCGSPIASDRLRSSGAEPPQDGDRHDRADDRRQELAERRGRPGQHGERHRARRSRTSARRPPAALPRIARMPTVMPSDEDHDRARRRRAPPCRSCRTVSIAQSLSGFGTKSMNTCPTGRPATPSPRRARRRPRQRRVPPRWPRGRARRHTRVPAVEP